MLALLLLQQMLLLLLLLLLLLSTPVARRCCDRWSSCPRCGGRFVAPSREEARTPATTATTQQQQQQRHCKALRGSSSSRRGVQTGGCGFIQQHLGGPPPCRQPTRAPANRCNATSRIYLQLQQHQQLLLLLMVQGVLTQTLVLSHAATG